MAKNAKIKATVKTPLLNEMLDYGVYVFSFGESLFIRLIGLLAGGMVGLIFYGGLFKVDGEATTATTVSNFVFFTVAGLLAIKFIVPVYRRYKLDKRKDVLAFQFRDMLEILSVSLSSGSNIYDAFVNALGDLMIQYEETDYIVKEIQQIIDGTMQNISIEAMLYDFGKRSHNEDIQNFANVFEICYRKGGNMQLVILRTHEVISEKASITDEIKTKLTSNRMQLNVLSIMPIGIVGLFKISNPSMAMNFVTPMGVFVNTIAIAIFIGAYKYGQKIIDIKG